MFWTFPSEYWKKIAVITQDQFLTYGELHSLCIAFMKKLPDSGILVALSCKNDLDTLVAWLACLNKKVPVLLVDARTSANMIAGLIERFAISAFIFDGKVTECKYHSLGVTADNRLAALISTSGSTGSAKHVALSDENLQSNANSICSYLPITSDDVTITTLPFNYSYGLSVINTHLMKGATVILTENSVTSRGFWEQLEKNKVNSFAGVPYTYEMLKRLGFLKKKFPALRYLTQAGGRLANNLVKEFSECLKQRGTSFYVMYGQTEATARIAWLEPKKLPRKLDSIGSAIPDGKLLLLDESKRVIESNDTPGELVYRGPNVMLGYANNSSELSRFYPPTDLFTGDLAKRDSDGDFFIIGRKKRFVKIFGSRLNLDEVENLLQQYGYRVKATGTDKALYIALNQTDIEQEVTQLLSKKIKLHPSVIYCKYLKSVPIKGNQKTDYEALLALMESNKNE